MTSLVKIEGIGEAYAQKLKDIGITTTEALLEQGAKPKGRRLVTPCYIVASQSPTAGRFERCARPPGADQSAILVNCTNASGCRTGCSSSSAIWRDSRARHSSDRHWAITRRSVALAGPTLAINSQISFIFQTCNHCFRIISGGVDNGGYFFRPIFCFHIGKVLFDEFRRFHQYALIGE